MMRRIATWIWAALLAVPIAFWAVALRIARPAAPDVADSLLGAAAALTAANVALAFYVPPRILPAAAGGREAVALSRALVGWALCDAAAIFPLVAFAVTRDAREVALAAAGLVALALSSPRPARWERLLPPAEDLGGAAGGVVR